MTKKRQYHRTAALLGAQAGVAPRGRRGRSRGRVRIKVPWQILVIAGLFIAGSLWMWLDPRWYVDATRLQVSGAASTASAREVVLAGQVLGMHGAWVRASEVVSQVQQALPSVIEAEANCWPYPAQCVITVRERVPVLVWHTPGGDWWVAEDGTIFSPNGERPNLPVVEGPLPDTERVPQAVLRGVEALAELGLASEGLTYHTLRGLVWHDPEGRSVAFGTGPEMALRWAIYQALSAQLDEEGIFPWAIDVSVVDAPTYSLERTW